MKRIQSVLCAAALAFALSTTVNAGNIHGVTATALGDIHGVTATAPGDIHGAPLSSSAYPDDTTDFLGYITGLIVISILGNIHG
jgi:hypothetical protein